MKNLLSTTTKPFIIYVLIILLVSIPVYYLVVDAIWKAELDEHNKTIAQKSTKAFNQLNLAEEDLQKSITLWNKIQPRTNIARVTKEDQLKDSVFTIEEVLEFDKGGSAERLRCFSTIIRIKNRNYRFTAETNIEESKETILAIGALTIFFFIVIVLGLILLTKKLSNTVWKPFRATLAALKSFSLNQHCEIDLKQSNIAEFEELNDSIKKLIAKNVAVYQSQKEFTENAAHELQTPLAVLKNKIDNFLQSPELSETQYREVEEMNNALRRSTRINKNLLLLSKIENKQFVQTAFIQFDLLLKECVELTKMLFEEKHLNVTLEISCEKTIQGNESLTEVLINNLLLNAIRHTPTNGLIKISLNLSGLEVCNSGNKALDEDLLFQRFSKTAQSKSGTGLGLAIAAEICNMHKWQIKYRFDHTSHIFSVRF